MVEPPPNALPNVVLASPNFGPFVLLFAVASPLRSPPNGDPAVAGPPPNMLGFDANAPNPEVLDAARAPKPEFANAEDEV